MATLNLSDLKTGVAHPLENSQSSGKCLIHMKLTDQCTKSIDALVHSRKVSVSVCVNCHVVSFAVIFVQGAFFSLRFSVAGGVSIYLCGVCVCVCVLIYELYMCNLTSHSLLYCDYSDNGDPSG